MTPNPTPFAPFPLPDPLSAPSKAGGGALNGQGKASAAPSRDLQQAQQRICAARYRKTHRKAEADRLRRWRAGKRVTSAP